MFRKLTQLAALLATLAAHSAHSAYDVRPDYGSLPPFDESQLAGEDQVADLKPALQTADPIHSQLTRVVEELSKEADDEDEALDATRHVFELFKKAFKKRYASQQEAARRFELFARNLRHVRRLVRRFSTGKASYSAGINEFADWNDTELKSLTGLLAPRSKSNWFGDHSSKADTTTSAPVTTPTTSTTTATSPFTASPEEEDEFAFESYPESVDWRRSRCILAPGSQGRCGSCYAFATLSVVETMQCIRRRRYARRLSPQQLVDCVKGSEASGCSGGWPREVLDSFVYNQSLVTTSGCYPYVAREGYCKLRALYRDRRTRNSCFLRAAPGDRLLVYRELHTMRQMMHYLTTTGPLIGAIEALRNFQRYSRGVFRDDDCRKGSGEHVNHAIAIIGYGTENGTDYWIIKNSWGGEWGVAGFGRVLRGTNECSIESVAWTVLN